MELREIHYTGVQPIEGYGPGFVRVGGQREAAPLIVLPRMLRGWAGLEDAAPLLALAGEVDVLIVGTGDEIAHLPGALRERLEAAGIGVEVMATPTAARAYNVLLSEGRRVAAALLPTS